jgi:hypothetical protein
MAEPIKDNEAVYDAEIAPLMDQIIAVCKREHIPLLASFQLTGNEDEQGSLLCTTALLPPRETPGFAIRLDDAYYVIIQKPVSFGIITSRNEA